MDAQGWVVIIGAIFLGLTQLLQMLLSYLRDRANVARIQRIASTTQELHLQGNSRWDEIKKELRAARDEIAVLQQMRVDDASKKRQ